MSYLKQTVRSYNDNFYPKLSRAKSFVKCLDNALRKSGGDALSQCNIIGWGEETRQFILDALECFDREVRLNIDMKG